MNQPRLPLGSLASPVDQVDQVKQAAINAGREVLTPQGTMYLFNLSEAAVRKARLRDTTGVVFTLTVTKRPVSMLSLNWAIKQWGKIDDERGRRLAWMRETRHTVGLDGQFYVILHPEPIACERHDWSLRSADSHHLDRAAS